ncbi:WD40 repeat-like protein [Anaeromyces robustus]|uniref:WD40 repeat-like protein n=1 Tax=Anaeromyces robustus TaxID=1754192 RepID=A0A1Y1XHU6_9FUNG|nr:WD40 repeat-like protein [Anaeromyces robustus]|eukprot:ORX85351.1 WD40 repeat-like protein [Anaeromyces robustus]
MHEKLNNETGKSKKRTSSFLKGLNNCFFNKNKTISKNKNNDTILKKVSGAQTNKRKNILYKDIILKCLQNLDLESLGKAKQTCKEWKTLIENNEQLIWRQLCKRYWGLDHKKYTNNHSHLIYDVQWKEIFLLNYNMEHENYYFTTHYQPFQLGKNQKRNRFQQTYLNINPYALQSLSDSLFSSYYPFPYPDPKTKIDSLKNKDKNKNSSSTLSNNGLLTPMASSSSGSGSSSNSSSPETLSKTSKDFFSIDEISSTSSSYPKKENNELSSSSHSNLSSSSSSSSSISIPPSTSDSPSSHLNNRSISENIEDSTSYLDLKDNDDDDNDDNDNDYDNNNDNDNDSDFSNSSSNSNEQPNFSSYLSKISFLNKFSNYHEKKTKRKYLMVWPYGRSEPYTVTFCNHYLFWIYNFRDIQVYDIETKKYVCRLKGHDGEIGLVLSNHQHYIVSFDLTSEIIVWDTRTLSIKKRFNVKDSLGLIISMSVHKDRMVATNNKGLIMVWNIITGDLITSYKIPKEFINPSEEENFTNVALWNDYIAFALQSNVYFIYDISKNKCINIMYHPQNQRAQAMFHLIRPLAISSRENEHENRRSDDNDSDNNINNDDDDNTEEDIDSNASNINQILALINNRQPFDYQNEIPAYQNINHHIPSLQTHPILGAETQEIMTPNPNNNNINHIVEDEEINEIENDNRNLEGDLVVVDPEFMEPMIINENNNNLHHDINLNPPVMAEGFEGEGEVEGEGNDNDNIGEGSEGELDDMIESRGQVQYPFTLAINSHLLLTNGPERNMLSIWSLKTGELLYNLSEERALEKLDLHLPTSRMIDLPSELSFAEFSTDYSFIFTTLQYEQESSLAVWDFRSDQYPQKTRYFDVLDLIIEDQPRKYWIGYEEEEDDDD